MFQVIFSIKKEHSYTPCRPSLRAGAWSVIVSIHGGAFRIGSKADRVPLALLAHGYAIVSINYRLSQHAIFPAQIEDCKAAVRWVRAHADTYHLDADPLVPYGQSVILVDALRRAGVPVTFYAVAGGGHGGFTDTQIVSVVEHFLHTL